MRDLTKEDKRTAKELLRKGILDRHEQWHKELQDLHFKSDIQFAFSGIFG